MREDRTPDQVDHVVALKVHKLMRDEIEIMVKAAEHVAETAPDKTIASRALMHKAMVLAIGEHLKSYEGIEGAQVMGFFEDLSVMIGSIFRMQIDVMREMTPGDKDAQQAGEKIAMKSALEAMARAANAKLVVVGEGDEVPDTAEFEGQESGRPPHPTKH